jgi:phospholipase C
MSETHPSNRHQNALFPRHALCAPDAFAGCTVRVPLALTQEGSIARDLASHSLLFFGVATLLLAFFLVHPCLAQSHPVPARTLGSSAAHTATQDELTKLVQKKIRYVFVIYQENRSFDSYFGTFPGADGLFSQDAAHTLGFNQQIADTDGKMISIHPFRIGPNEHPCGAVSDCFAADTDDVGHSHPAILSKMDIQNDDPKMDRFALEEEKRNWRSGSTPSLRAKQFGELSMAYEDCDTVPLLWRYASRFVLFDHIFQLMTGPSTPGNLSIIGAQTGVTQWIEHPPLAYKGNGSSGPGVPVLDDNDPFWGSPDDPTPKNEKMPVNPRDFSGLFPYGAAINLTYATLPLSLLGSEAANATRHDQNPAIDLTDVKNDVQFLSRLKQKSVAFGWYQEGYGDEKPASGDDDDDPTDAAGVHASYITHHNGPQYFGYIANNPKMRGQLHDLGDFSKAIEQRTLPAGGGVFYVKGGEKNTVGLKPADSDRAVARSFLGDDDHPGYSDAQISEAMAATMINEIALSPYWKNSAIIITWDDSEGDYDHIPPPLTVKGPDGSFISDGPRVPLLLISPYARTHFVAHEKGNHASVVKFVDAVFGLTPLAKLPDEFAARELGQKEYGQSDLGPEDAITKNVSDLLEAFDPERLRGVKATLPPSYAFIPWSLVRRLPEETGYGCKSLGIVTTDRAKKIPNAIPADFNPRPKTDPIQ